MKSAATITLLIGAAAAFAPSMTTLPAMMRPTSSQFVLFADPKEEEGGLDLNLEEMFDMFDAADKGQDFDKVIKDVKKEKAK